MDRHEEYGIELTMKEVAGFAGYHYVYVRSLGSEGTLPARRLENGHRRIALGDLLDYLGRKAPKRVDRVVEPVRCFS